MTLKYTDVPAIPVHLVPTPSGVGAIGSGPADMDESISIVPAQEDATILINAQTMEQDRASAWFDLGPRKGFSLEIFTTGGFTHDGPLYIRASNTQAHYGILDTFIINPGALISDVIEQVDIQSRHIQLFWDRTAGLITEFLTVVIYAKL